MQSCFLYLHFLIKWVSGKYLPCPSSEPATGATARMETYVVSDLIKTWSKYLYFPWVCCLENQGANDRWTSLGLKTRGQEGLWQPVMWGRNRKDVEKKLLRPRSSEAVGKKREKAQEWSVRAWFRYHEILKNEQMVDLYLWAIQLNYENKHELKRKSYKGHLQYNSK